MIKKEIKVYNRNPALNMAAIDLRKGLNQTLLIGANEVITIIIRFYALLQHRHKSLKSLSKPRWKDEESIFHRETDHVVRICEVEGDLRK